MKISLIFAIGLTLSSSAGAMTTVSHERMRSHPLDEQLDPSNVTDTQSPRAPHFNPEAYTNFSPRDPIVQRRMSLSATDIDCMQYAVTQLDGNRTMTVRDSRCPDPEARVRAENEKRTKTTVIGGR